MALYFEYNVEVVDSWENSEIAWIQKKKLDSFYSHNISNRDDPKCKDMFIQVMKATYVLPSIHKC